MNKPIYIYGAGGLGSEIKAMLLQMKGWSVAGFYDDGLEKESLVEGLLIKGGLQELLSQQEPIHLVMALGDPSVKLRLVKQLKLNLFLHFPTLIHESSSLLDKVKLGDGCIITAGARLTTNISVGNHTLINLNATIGHGAKIGEACSIMPGANLAGDVILEDGVLIGSGATILNGVKIGDGASVGAGAVVTKDVDPFTVVVGVPARQVR